MGEDTLKVTFCGRYTDEEKAKVLEWVRSRLEEDKLDVPVTVEEAKPAEPACGVFINVLEDPSC